MGDGQVEIEMRREQRHTLLIDELRLGLDDTELVQQGLCLKRSERNEIAIANM